MEVILKKLQTNLENYNQMGDGEEKQYFLKDQIHPLFGTLISQIRLLIAADKYKDAATLRDQFYDVLSENGKNPDNVLPLKEGLAGLIVRDIKERQSQGGEDNIGQIASAIKQNGFITEQQYRGLFTQTFVTWSFISPSAQVKELVQGIEEAEKHKSGVTHLINQLQSFLQGGATATGDVVTPGQPDALPSLSKYAKQELAGYVVSRLYAGQLSYDTTGIILALLAPDTKDTRFELFHELEMIRTTPLNEEALKRIKTSIQTLKKEGWSQDEFRAITQKIACFLENNIISLEQAGVLLATGEAVGEHLKVDMKIDQRIKAMNDARTNVQTMAQEVNGLLQNVNFSHKILSEQNDRIKQQNQGYAAKFFEAVKAKDYQRSTDALVDAPLAGHCSWQASIEARRIKPSLQAQAITL